MPADPNAPVTEEERLTVCRRLFGDGDLAYACAVDEGRDTRLMLDALCLARRRERALREAIEAAKRDCPACDGTGTLVSQNSEINGCGCGQCADFDRALDATDSAKGER